MQLDLSQPSFRNRISLWVGALYNTERNLILAERAIAWRESESVLADVRVNRGTSNNYNAEAPYEGFRERVFPMLFECDDIVASAMTSAIGYYAQTLTTGNADGKRIRSNSPQFCSDLWEHSFDYLETKGIPKASVKELNATVLQARNGMIAHADAKKFNATMNANGEMVSCRVYDNSWDSIAPKLWLKISYMLKNKLLQLSRGEDLAG